MDWRVDHRAHELLTPPPPPVPDRDDARAAGLLLHLTSLPGPYGIGDLGPAAHAFVDALARARQTRWQILPLGPVGEGGSPYASPSAFAGNPLLVSPDRLRAQGLVTDDALAPLRALPADRVAFDRLAPRKRALLDAAYRRFTRGAGTADAPPADAFARFRAREASWLSDYALFAALREAHDGAPWSDWDAPLARRHPDALAAARDRHADAVRRHAFAQFLFQRQWDALRAHAAARGVRFVGDLPIYVAYDSADVWAHQDRFQLDDAGRPTAVAGVPPDYFSDTGQLWGNPLYRWDRMARDGFAWWMRRLERLLRLVDVVRIDHFRALANYWRVPADADTAVDGHWADGPGDAFLDAARARLGSLPLIAEDLGVDMAPAYALRDRHGLPGMAVLQFGFDGDPDSPFLPHNYRRRLVAYPGTHDNAPLVAWWRHDLGDEARARAARYLDATGASDLPWRAIRMLLASAARTVVVPAQDVLGLGAAARMNTPATPSGNWTWRLPPGALPPPTLDRLGALTRAFGRAPR